MPDSATIQPDQIGLTPPQPVLRVPDPSGSGKTLWTREAASIAGKKGKQVQMERAEQRAALSLNIGNSQPIQPAKQPDSAQLIRARAQVDSMEKRLEAALDDAGTLPIDLDRLTRAAGSLREQVRILEGRPLPGARRPGPERVRREGPAAPLD